MREKYREPVSSDFLQGLEDLCKRFGDVVGIHPLETWKVRDKPETDWDKAILYQECRYKKDSFKSQVQIEGVTQVKTLEALKGLKKQGLAQEGQKDRSKGQWESPAPPKGNISLQFKESYQVITNSFPIDQFYVQLHQYVLSIEPDVGDMETREELYRQKISHRLFEIRPCYYDGLHVMSFKNQTETKKEIIFKVDGNLKSRPNRGDKSEATEMKRDTEKPRDIDMSEKPKEYQVRLSFVKKISLDDEKAMTEAPSPSVLQGLAILNRSYVSNAGYKKLHPKSDVWFKMTEKEKTSSGDNIHQDGTNMNAPDLRMLNGFHCAPFQGRPKTVLKTIKQCKGVTKYTVRDFINDNRDWEDKIKGLTAVVMYSTYSFRIFDFDKGKTEKSTFMKDGKAISYKEYVTRFKKFDCRDGEPCLVIERKRKRQNNKDKNKDKDKDKEKQNEDEFEYSHFLPSTLMLVPRNEMQTNEARAHLRVRNTVSGEEHIAGAIDFHKDVASSRGNNSFKVNTQPLRTTGFLLNIPSLVLIDKGQRTLALPLDKTFGGAIWGRSIGAVVPPPTIKDAFSPLTIMIFYDSKSQEAKERFLDGWKFMKEKRGFHVPPFRDPIAEEFPFLDMRHNDPMFGKLRDMIRNQCDMAIVIIPSSEQGSKIKVEITRHVMFRQQHSGLEKSEKWGGHMNTSKGSKNKNNNMLNLQFITDYNCMNNHSVSSTIETCMAKAGFTLYTINPQLPCNRVINLHKAWMVGITLRREANRPAILVLTCMHNGLEGSMVRTHSRCIMLPAHKHVCAFNIFYKLFLQLMTDGAEMAKLYGDEFPENIICLRLSVPDGAFQELQSKEIRALRLVLKDCKNIVKKWTPELFYAVVQTQIIDRFSVQDDKGELVPVPDPIVVVDAVTTPTFNEFIMYLPKVQEQKKIIGQYLRYICLCDDWKTGNTIVPLLKDPYRFSDLVQFIYATHFSYVTGLPFIKGAPTLPAVLLWARHFADWENGLLMKDDRTLSDVQVEGNINLGGKPFASDISKT